MTFCSKFILLLMFILILNTDSALANTIPTLTNPNWEPATYIVSPTIIFSLDGSLMAICGGINKEGRAYIWNLKLGKQIETIKFSARVLTAAFTFDNNQLISGQQDGTVSVYDVKNNKQIFVTNLFNGFWVSALAISPLNNQLIAVGSQNGTLVLWNAVTHKIIKDFKGHFYGIRSLTFNNQGNRLISTGDDQRLFLWDTTTGKLLKAYHRDANTLKAHIGMVRTAIFLDDNRVLSGAYWEGGTAPAYTNLRPPDEPLRVWNSETGLPIKSYQLTWGVSCCLQKLNNQEIVLQKLTQWNPAEQVIDVFDISQNKLIKEFKDPDPASATNDFGVQAFGLLPGTSLLFINLASGRILIWNATTGKTLGSLVSEDDGWAVVDNQQDYDASENFFKDKTNSTIIIDKPAIPGLLTKLIQQQ